VIKVLVTGYNCPEWIGRGLASVRDQDLDEPFEVCMVDDGSTDPAQREAMLAVLDTVPEVQTWHLLLRGSNRKATFSVQQAMIILDPDPYDIVVLLDGDDYLAPWALSYLRDMYERDANCWLTYGQYEPVPHNTGQVLASAYPREVLDRRTFRQHPIVFNHPYSFRYFLFSKVRIADAQDASGNWFRAGMDQVYLYPMLEMAGKHHIRFIDKTLYYYNAVNPRSETHIQDEEPNPGELIRSLPKRELLRHRP